MAATVTGRARDRRSRSIRALPRGAIGYVYLAPVIVVFGLFAWYPIVRGVILAFQQDNLVAPPTWVGLANFRRVFHDEFFAVAWKNTFEFVGLGLLVGYAVPLLFAVAFNEMRHGLWYFRLMAYLPVVLPPVVSVLLWKWFYDPGPGLFDSILRYVHLPTSEWIQAPGSSLISILLLVVWSGFGGTVLIYLASMQGISGNLYEAAELDGAGFVGRIWHIMLPQMRYILLVIALLQVIGAMQLFTEPYVMTDGGPNGSTTTVVLLIYNYAFRQSDYGAAAALSVLLALALGVLTVIYLVLTRRWSRD